LVGVFLFRDFIVLREQHKNDTCRNLRCVRSVAYFNEHRCATMYKTYMNLVMVS
jgi:hypothetical protein